MIKENKIPLIEVKSNSRTFQWSGEPELIHIIRTGFKDRYMVVHEDAYEHSLGKVELLSKNEIQNIYSIEI
jgi:hypothetical protein